MNTKNKLVASLMTYFVLMFAYMVGTSFAATEQTAEQLEFQAAQKMARSFPKKAEASIRLGQASAVVGENTLAISSFERALKLEPDNLHARIELYSLFKRLGNKQGADEQARILREKSGLSQQDAALEADLRAMVQGGSGLSAVKAQKAAELISSGNAGEATKLLQFQGDQDDPATVFLLGLAASRQGEFRQAVEYFRKVLALEPGNDRVRLELAAALYADRQFGDAQAELLTLKERTLPPATVQTLDRFLEATQAAQAKPWRIRGAVSYLFDSNVSQGPFASGVTTTLGRVALPELSQARADSGMVYSLDGDYTYLFNENFGWQFQALGKLTDYFNVNEFDTLQLNAATGPTANFGRFTVSFPLTYSFLKYNFNSDGYYYMATGGAPQVRYRISDKLFATAALGYQHKFYDTQYDRYANVLSPVVSLRYFIDDRSFVDVGGNYTYEKQNRDIYSYNNYGGFASYFRTVMPNLTAGASVQLNWYDYLQEREIFGKTQHDFTINTKLSVGYTIEALWKLTPELIYSFTHNGSTIPLYTYDRHQITAGISRTF